MSLSSSHKTKLSLAKMGKLNPNYGRPDAINNIKWVSGEGQSPWIGRKHPESTKQKISQTLRSKTHCKRGHVFDSDNTMVVKKTGQRLCKQCHRARARATYARAKGGNNG